MTCVFDVGGNIVAHTTMIGRTRIYKKPCSFVVGGGQGFPKNLAVLLLDEDNRLQKTLKNLNV